MNIEISLMGRVTKFLNDQLLENIMKFAKALYDTTNSVQPNLEHFENIYQIHDAADACTTNAVEDSAYTDWLGSRAWTQHKIRKVLDVAMLLLFLNFFHSF